MAKKEKLSDNGKLVEQHYRLALETVGKTVADVNLKTEYKEKEIAKIPLKVPTNGDEKEALLVETVVRRLQKTGFAVYRYGPDYYLGWSKKPNIPKDFEPV